jgi:hypothetical protein
MARDWNLSGILLRAMADTSAPAPPFPAEDVSPPARAAGDPLEGDWSEGLRGPLRAHGIAPPRRLSLEDLAQASAIPTNGATAAESAIVVAHAPPAGDASPLAAAEPAPPAVPGPPEPQHASAVQLEAPSESAPTPWSEPVTGPVPEAAGSESGTVTGWDQAASASAVPAEQQPAPSDAWSAAPQEPVPEWQTETAPSDWQEAPKAEAAATVAAGTDWSSLRSGPDWSASSGPEQPQAEAWGAAPPATEQSEWSAATPAPVESEWASPAPAAAPEWSATPAAAVEEWDVPITETPPETEAVAADPAPPAAPKPAWNQPAVGATALEQLDSQPPEPEPGAAKELFGSVPAGASLGAAYDELGAPEELASPEEVLRPVAIDHDDPDLPAPTGEPARTRAQPLASLRPNAVNALEMQGEHRVAVHTRGGRTLRGTMRDIDLSKSQFPLIPQGGGEPEPIYRSDVKAIFFMLAPGEPPHAGDGAKVRVTFSDGRVIEGVRDGVDAKHGFFLVPLDAARTNTRRIYVAREATSEIKDS